MTKGNIRRHSGCQEFLVSATKDPIAGRSAWAAAKTAGGPGERRCFVRVNVVSTR